MPKGRGYGSKRGNPTKPRKAAPKGSKRAPAKPKPKKK